MPRRDPEKYREYMRNYMNRKNELLRAERNARDGLPLNKKFVKRRRTKKMSNDFNAKKGEINSNIEIKKSNDGKIDFSSVIEKTEEMTKDKVTGESDPIFKYIKLAERYAPVIMQFAKGFADNFKQNQRVMQSQQVEQKPRGIEPPQGWLSMSPLEKLNRKYKYPSWYEQGLRYDESLQGVSEIQTRQEPVRSRNPQEVQRSPVNEEPKNLNELSRKYPEAPLIEDNKPQDQTENNKSEVENSEPSEVEKIKMILEEDNKKYVQMAVNYLQSLDDKEFIDKLENLDQLKSKFEFFKMFIPVHVKEMLNNTPTSEFINIFKVSCPEKFSILEDLQKTDLIRDLFEDFKKDL